MNERLKHKETTERIKALQTVKLFAKQLFNNTREGYIKLCRSFDKKLVLCLLPIEFYSTEGGL